MNIPQSSIEPFGYGSIPILNDLMHERKTKVLNPILKFRNQVHAMKSSFNNKRIIDSVEYIADKCQAINPECTHVVDITDGRVFQIEFGVIGYPRRIIFGFNIYNQ